MATPDSVIRTYYVITGLYSFAASLISGVNTLFLLDAGLTVFEVFVANGYYDLATPYFATEYTFDHLGLEKPRQDNVSMAYYEAGHMMYLHEPSMKKYREDLASFIRDTDRL